MVQHLHFRVLKFPFYPIIVFNSSVNFHGWIMPSRQKTPNTTRSVQNFGGCHVSTFKVEHIHASLQSLLVCTGQESGVQHWTLRNSRKSPVKEPVSHHFPFKSSFRFWDWSKRHGVLKIRDCRGSPKSMGFNTKKGLLDLGYPHVNKTQFYLLKIDSKTTVSHASDWKQPCLKLLNIYGGYFLEDGIQQTLSFLVIPRIAPGNQTWLAGAQWALQCPR